MRVIILGCGPAGLLAAHACEQLGHEVRILSRQEKSVIPGAVFLHEPIPDLTAPQPDGAVKFIKHGTKRGYAKKVYGHEDADCSWDLFPEGDRPAWSMFGLYDKLWMRYIDRIVDIDITPYIIRLLSDKNPGRIISTIPANAICENREHKFERQYIYVLDRSVDPSLVNAIVYNGSMNDAWYRTSNLFGAEATESTLPFAPETVKQFDANRNMGYKPIKTDCDCHPIVDRIGRFGRWEKGILVHHAYKQTIQLLEASD